MNLRLFAVAALSLAIVAGCGRKGPKADERLVAHDDARAAAARFDPERPAPSLAIDADEAARRLGSFEWTAGVEWTVARQGSTDRLRVVEGHRVIQAVTGDFFAGSVIDPGLGDGAVTGRDVIWAGSMTYARGRWAPWRERPGD
ncbi:MAG: lipoprotein, partial [Anaeromyxobacteraceae bacterium]